MGEIAKQTLLAACALVGASVSILLLGAVYWAAVSIGFSIATSGAPRLVVFTIACIVGATLVVLLARSAFRSVEFLVGRRRADSVALVALLSAAAGLTLGTLMRNVLFGSEARVYAPIYVVGFAASVAGVWLGARLNARRGSSAV